MSRKRDNADRAHRARRKRRTAAGAAQHQQHQQHQQHLDPLHLTKALGRCGLCLADTMESKSILEVGGGQGWSGEILTCGRCRAWGLEDFLLRYGFSRLATYVRLNLQALERQWRWQEDRRRRAEQGWGAAGA